MKPPTLDQLRAELAWLEERRHRREFRGGRMLTEVRVLRWVVGAVDAPPSAEHLAETNKRALHRRRQ